MSKEKKPEDLWEKVINVVEIECDKCRVLDTYFASEIDQACEVFFDKGWRSTPNKTYCPKCAKKYLKP